MPDPGTALNKATVAGGDTIDTENPGDGLPLLPRSKIVLGDRDVDAHDVSAANPLPVTGSVSVTGSVTTTPSGTQTVTGAVSISGTPTVDVGNFPSDQVVSGTVAISGTVPVSAASLPLPSTSAPSIRK
jgi:hypothetical protein